MFRQAQVTFYSFKEWEMLEEWSLSGALGFYSQEDNTLHILKYLKGLREQEDSDSPYANIPDWYVKCTLVHEYTHWLQWKKGKGVNPLAIRYVEIDSKVKTIYPQSEWEIESEAKWVETHPEALDEFEALVEAFLNPPVQEEEVIPEPPFEYIEISEWKVEDISGVTWVWSPVWEQWEEENLYDDYE